MPNPNKTCTNHCPCPHLPGGRHFHSLAAFDAHLGRDETGWPIHLDPLDIVDGKGEMRLVVYSDDAECRMYTETQHHVTVWTTAGYEEVGDRWKGPGTPQEAAGDDASTQAVGEGPA